MNLKDRRVEKLMGELWTFLTSLEAILIEFISGYKQFSNPWKSSL